MRHKTYSAINVAGLALLISAAAWLFTWWPVSSSALILFIPIRNVFIVSDINSHGQRRQP